MSERREIFLVPSPSTVRRSDWTVQLSPSHFEVV